MKKQKRHLTWCMCIIERTNFNKIIAMQEPFQNHLIHCYLFLNEL